MLTASGFLKEFTAEFLNSKAEKPPDYLLECINSVNTSSAVSLAASSINLPSVFFIRFEPASELQLLDMQQVVECFVWQLRLRLTLIATRRARMNLQPSFICRPYPNLLHFGS